MASNLKTVEFLCDQICGIGDVRYKKMFGEYIIYLNNKPIFLICDDTLFVKINDTTKTFEDENMSEGYPYEGASLHYIIDFIDDRERLVALASALEKVIPLPKVRKSKNNI